MRQGTGGRGQGAGGREQGAGGINHSLPLCVTLRFPTLREAAKASNAPLCVKKSFILLPNTNIYYNRAIINPQSEKIKSN
ncbi:hypothetical protein Cal6303_4008 [Calothrix sp. PCC 6303]|nr:hypothetical protein Cal6303_4008 [Calothrix sp. PCC 6303]